MKIINGTIQDAVILAGGKGERLHNGNISSSKCMIPVCGKPLISYVIDALLFVGIKKIHIVYCESASDVLGLSMLSELYRKSINYLEDYEQYGVLNAINYASRVVSLPFILSFGDIIVQEVDVYEMISKAIDNRDNRPDLFLQTVEHASIEHERNILLSENKVIDWNKQGRFDRMEDCYKIRSGGMMQLWVNSPFECITKNIGDKQFGFSEFIRQYIVTHNVLEMPIKDLWDIDTLDNISETERLLLNRKDRIF